MYSALLRLPLNTPASVIQVTCQIRVRCIASVTFLASSRLATRAGPCFAQSCTHTHCWHHARKGHREPSRSAQCSCHHVRMNLPGPPCDGCNDHTTNRYYCASSAVNLTRLRSHAVPHFSLTPCCRYKAVLLLQSPAPNALHTPQDRVLRTTLSHPFCATSSTPSPRHVTNHTAPHTHHAGPCAARAT